MRPFVPSGSVADSRDAGRRPLTTQTDWHIDISAERQIIWIWVEKTRLRYAEHIADMTADSKKHWSAVNELLHINDRPTSPPSKEAIQQCDLVSSLFTTKICRMKDTIASRLIGKVRDPFTFDKLHVGPQLSVLSPVTTEEVKKLLRTMPSKSSPMDFVPTSMLKRCSGVFAPLIARLTKLKLSFIEGRFPAQFKQEQITLSLKKTGMDVDDPASYRPISNLTRYLKPWSD